MTELYLTRYAYPREFLGDTEPVKNLGMIVAIPCYAEYDLIPTLQSIHDCGNPGVNVEVIVVINHSVNSPVEIKNINEKTYSDTCRWTSGIERGWIRYHFIRAYELPPKTAGVGLARKIAMDEAVRRFHRAGNNEGIIACLDADCICDKNYLQIIRNHFLIKSGSNGANVYFEHPLINNVTGKPDHGIAAYELHLRYMVHALRYSGFPYAYHTIGSCMVIPVSVYMKQGGMNTRKAGEDFYFLHKIFPLGNFHEINETRIIPSPRQSNRVPFGTGKAMLDWIREGKTNYLTYNPLIYKDLKKLIEFISLIYESPKNHSDEPGNLIPDSVRSYLTGENWLGRITDCKNNSRTKKSYDYMVFKWLNGLKIVRFLNYASHCFYPETDIGSAATRMLDWRFGKKFAGRVSDIDLLEFYRKADRSGN